MKTTEKRPSPCSQVLDAVWRAGAMHAALPHGRARRRLWRIVSSTTPAPDVTGSWAISYGTTMDVKVNIAGSIYAQSLPATGGSFTVTHQGAPPRLQRRLQQARSRLPQRGLAGQRRHRSARQDLSAPHVGPHSDAELLWHHHGAEVQRVRRRDHQSRLQAGVQRHGHDLFSRCLRPD